jgi:hypothetical protein
MHIQLRAAMVIQPRQQSRHQTPSDGYAADRPESANFTAIRATTRSHELQVDSNSRSMRLCRESRNASTSHLRKKTLDPRS